MKNSKLLLSGLFIAVVLTSCKKEVVVNPNTPQNSASISTVENSSAAATVQADLPSAARDFLKQHYLNEGIAKYEVKNATIVGNKTEVKLVNGVEVDFDSTGNWMEIQDPKGVPEAVLPAEISTYVKTNYKGAVIESAEKEKDLYKIELSNDIDLQFDKSGKFIKIKP